MNHKAKIIKLTELTVKIIIVLLGIYVLYKKIIVNQNISDLWIDIEKTFTNKNQFNLLILALLLVPLNIFLEGVNLIINIIIRCYTFFSFNKLTISFFRHNHRTIPWCLHSRTHKLKHKTNRFIKYLILLYIH